MRARRAGSTVSWACGRWSAAIDAGCAFFDTAVLLWPQHQRNHDRRGAAPAARSQTTSSRLRPKPGAATRAMITALTASCAASHGSLERMGLESIEIVYIHDAMGQPMDARCWRMTARSAPCGICRRSGLLRVYRHGFQRPGHQSWNTSRPVSLMPPSLPIPGA